MPVDWPAGRAATVSTRARSSAWSRPPAAIRCSSSNGHGPCAMPVTRFPGSNPRPAEPPFRTPPCRSRRRGFRHPARFPAVADRQQRGGARDPAARGLPGPGVRTLGGLARLSTLDRASLDAALKAWCAPSSSAARRRRARDGCASGTTCCARPPTRAWIRTSAFAATASCTSRSRRAVRPTRRCCPTTPSKPGANGRPRARRAGRGERAAPSAFREAILHFDRAVEILASLPSDPARHVALLVRSAHASIGGNGFAHPATAARFERARALLERCPDSPERYPVAYGRWAVMFFAGRYGDALRHARATRRVAPRDTRGAVPRAPPARYQPLHTRRAGRGGAALPARDGTLRATPSVPP